MASSRRVRPGPRAAPRRRTHRRRARRSARAAGTTRCTGRTSAAPEAGRRSSPPRPARPPAPGCARRAGGTRRRRARITANASSATLIGASDGCSAQIEKTSGRLSWKPSVWLQTSTRPPEGRNTAIEAPNVITNAARALRTAPSSSSPRPTATSGSRIAGNHLAAAPTPTRIPRLIGLVSVSMIRTTTSAIEPVVGALLHAEQAERARRPQPGEQQPELAVLRAVRAGAARTPIRPAIVSRSKVMAAARAAGR